jgi:signal transduction histidine kinase
MELASEHPSSTPPLPARSISAWVALSLSGVAIAFGLGIGALHAAAIAQARAIPEADYWLFNALVAVGFSVSGAAIAIRRPRNPIGWAFIAGAVGNGVAGIGGEYAVLTGDPIGYWLFRWAWIPLPVAIAVTLHTFPTGEPLSPRWRPVVLAIIVAGVAAMIVGATSAPSLGDPPEFRGPPVLIHWPAGMADLLLPALGVGAASGVATLVLRFRRSRGDEREQLKWLVLAGVPLVVTFAGIGNVLVSAVAVLLVAVPVALAILRFHLYDIDLIINRGLVYGVLGLLVAAAYLVLATALARLAGGEGSPLTSTMATVAAALVALAARQAVQEAIGRLLYARRGDPLAVIRSVARRLENAGTPEELLAGVVDDIRVALKLDGVAVYAVDGALLAGEERARTGARLSLAHQGELVGELAVWTARGDALKPGDLRLLQDDLGPQLAVAIEAIRLKRDLQGARERLVAALEDERRRLRHDLHDGLGPTLTAITLRADAAINVLGKDPPRARELLSELRVAAADAIGEVRHLVEGLRPKALDELGLLGAIREQATGLDRAGLAVPDVVIVVGPPLPPLPAAVEVAAYRIATEAITNAIRHGGARQCRVRIIANASLVVEVTDDGHGWEGPLIPGVGIQSMRERAADLGGTLRIERAPGGGTSVLARLPLSAEGVS